MLGLISSLLCLGLKGFASFVEHFILISTTHWSWFTQIFMLSIKFQYRYVFMTSYCLIVFRDHMLTIQELICKRLLVTTMFLSWTLLIYLGLRIVMTTLVSTAHITTRLLKMVSFWVCVGTAFWVSLLICSFLECIIYLAPFQWKLLNFCWHI